MFDSNNLGILGTPSMFRTTKGPSSMFEPCRNFSEGYFSKFVTLVTNQLAQRENLTGVASPQDSARAPKHRGTTKTQGIVFDDSASLRPIRSTACISLKTLA